MTDTGWRMTYVFSDGTPHGFTVTSEPGPLMPHDDVMARIEAIEIDAKLNPGEWPGFLGCGMEFRSETE